MPHPYEVCLQLYVSPNCQDQLLQDCCGFVATWAAFQVLAGLVLKENTTNSASEHRWCVLLTSVQTGLELLLRLLECLTCLEASGRPACAEAVSSM